MSQNKIGTPFDLKFVSGDESGLIYAEDIIWEGWDGIVPGGNTGNETTPLYVSYIFTRCSKQPDAPSNINESCPTELVKIDGQETTLYWYDSIPSGTDTVYMSCRLFKKGNNNGWSTPIPLADTLDFDVEFSTYHECTRMEIDGQDDPRSHGFSEEALRIKDTCYWSNEGTNAIWMATSKLNNGVWSPWQYIKIKGEDGKGTGVLDFDQDMINLSYDADGDIYADPDLKKYYLSYYFNNERDTSFDYDNLYGSANGEVIICGKDENGLYIDLQLDKLPNCLKHCSYDKNVVFIEIAVTINGRLYTDTFRVLQLKNSAEYQLMVPNTIYFDEEETEKSYDIQVYKTLYDGNSFKSTLLTDLSKVNIKVNNSAYPASGNKITLQAEYEKNSVIKIELYKDAILYDYADINLIKYNVNSSVLQVSIFGIGTATECSLTRDKNEIPEGWALYPNINLSKDEYVWMATGKTVNGNFVKVDGDYYWSEPFRITGIAGNSSSSSTGADGVDINFVYYITNNEKDLLAPDNDDADELETYFKSNDDYNGWRDHPTGVSKELKYEYISINIKRNGSWIGWTTPVLWSSYGVQGMDGDGVEYIFCLSNNYYIEDNDLNRLLDTSSAKNGCYKTEYDEGYDETKPTAKTELDDDFIPARGYNADEKHDTSFDWYDDPRPVSQDNHYQYVSIRKKTWDENGKAKKWGPFSTPRLWSKWAKDGESVEYKLCCDNDNVIVDDDSLQTSFATAAKTTFWLTYQGYKTSEGVSFELAEDSNGFNEFTPKINSNTGELTFTPIVNKSFTDGLAFQIKVNAKVDGVFVSSKTQIIQVKNFNGGDSYRLIVSPNSFTVSNNGETYIDSNPSLQVSYTKITDKSTTNNILNGKNNIQHTDYELDSNNLVFEIEADGTTPVNVLDDDTQINLLTGDEVLPNYYVVNLYYVPDSHNKDNRILVDSETVDLVRSGKDGGKGDSNWYLSLDNDTAVIDDTIKDKDTYNANIKTGTTVRATLYYGEKEYDKDYEVYVAETSELGSIKKDGNKVGSFCINDSDIPKGFYLYVDADEPDEPLENLSIEKGSYGYTIGAYVNNEIVAQKRFTFNVSDISPDGSMYSLNITNDVWSYNGDNNDLLDDETSSTISVIKIENGVITTPEFSVKSNEEDHTNNELCVVYPEGLSVDGKDITPDAKYKNIGYDIELYYGNTLLDSEHISCVKHGKSGEDSNVPGPQGDSHLGTVTWYTNCITGYPTLSEISLDILAKLYSKTYNTYVNNDITWQWDTIIPDSSYTIWRFDVRAYGNSIDKVPEYYDYTSPQLHCTPINTTLNLNAAVLRMRGEWKAGTIEEPVKYYDGTPVENNSGKVTENADKYKDIVILYDSDKKPHYYVCNITHESSDATKPDTDGGENAWTEMEDYEAIATKVLLALNILSDMILSGELIVSKNAESNGLYLCTQEEGQSTVGVIADYSPNDIPDGGGQAIHGSKFKLLLGDINRLFLGNGMQLVIGAPDLDKDGNPIYKDPYGAIYDISAKLFAMAFNDDLKGDIATYVFGSEGFKGALSNELSDQLSTIEWDKTSLRTYFEENTSGFVQKSKFTLSSNGFEFNVEDKDGLAVTLITSQGASSTYTSKSDFETYQTIVNETADGLSVLSNRVSKNETDIAALDINPDEIMEAVDLIKNADYITSSLLSTKADEILSTVGEYNNLITDTKFEHVVSLIKNITTEDWCGIGSVASKKYIKTISGDEDTIITLNKNILELNLEYTLIFVVEATEGFDFVLTYDSNFNEDDKIHVPKGTSTVKVKFTHTEDKHLKIYSVGTDNDEQITIKLSNPHLTSKDNFVTKSYVDLKADEINIGVKDQFTEANTKYASSSIESTVKSLDNTVKSTVILSLNSIQNKVENLLKIENKLIGNFNTFEIYSQSTKDDLNVLLFKSEPRVVGQNNYVWDLRKESVTHPSDYFIITYNSMLEKDVECTLTFDIVSSVISNAAYTPDKLIDIKINDEYITREQNILGDEVHISEYELKYTYERTIALGIYERSGYKTFTIKFIPNLEVTKIEIIPDNCSKESFCIKNIILELEQYIANLGSYVNQSVDNINLSVKNGLKETGIDIDLNQITLSGNTVINGDCVMSGLLAATSGFFGNPLSLADQIYIDETGLHLGANVALNFSNDLSDTDIDDVIADFQETLNSKLDANTVKDVITSTYINNNVVITPELITSQLYSTEGAIGGFKIDNSKLEYCPIGNTMGSDNTFGIYPKGYNKSPYSIAGSNTKNDWKLTIGNNFGIDSQGNVYANNANISALTVVENIIEIQIPDSLSGTKTYNKSNLETNGSDKAYTITGDSNKYIITIHQSGSYDIIKPKTNSESHVKLIGVKFDFNNNDSHYVTLYNSDCDHVCCPNWLTSYVKPINPTKYKGYEINNYGYLGRWNHYCGEYEVTIDSYSLYKNSNNISYQDKPIFIDFKGFANSSFLSSTGVFGDELTINDVFIEQFGFIGGKIELVFTSKYDSTPALINNSSYSFCASNIHHRYSYTSATEKTHLTVGYNDLNSIKIDGLIWTMYAGKDVTGYLIDKANMYDVDNLFK